MSWKKTIVVLAIFVIAVGYYLWDQGRIERREKADQLASQLIRPDRQELAEITIHRGEEQIVLRKGEQGQWMLDEPIRYRASREVIANILDELESAEKTSSFKVDQAQLEQYALADPELVVHVKAPGQDYARSIELGTTTPAGEEAYGRVPGQSEVFTVRKQLKSSLDKEVWAIRDKHLLPVDVTQATSLTLTLGDNTLKLEKEGPDWRIIEPRPLPADNMAVADFLGHWNDAEAKDFIDLQTDEPDETPYGLAPPTWSGTVYVENDDRAASYTLRIGDRTSTGSQRRYAAEPGAHTILEIAETDYEQLDVSLNQLRSKELFQAEPYQISWLRIESREGTIELAKTEQEDWRFPDKPELNLDQSQVRRKIEQIANLEAQRFLSEPPAPADSGLDEPNLVITLRLTDEATTRGLMTGRLDAQHNQVYARRFGDHEEYAMLDFSAPGNFFLSPEDLIDKRLFDFEVTDVQRVELTEGDRQFTLTRDERIWRGRAGTSQTTWQIEPMKMNILLYALAALDYARRLDPVTEADQILIEEYSLDQPERTIIVYGEDDQVLARLEQGDQTRRQVYVTYGKDRYAAIETERFSAVSRAIDTVLESARPEADE